MLNKITARLTPCLRLNPLNWFAMTMFAFHLVEVHISGGIHQFFWTVPDVLSIMYSFFTLYVVFVLVTALTAGSRFWYVAGHTKIVLLFGVLSSYLFSAKTSLDMSVILENFSSADSKNAFAVMFNSFNWQPLQLAILGIMVFLILEWRKKTVSRQKPEKFHPGLAAGVFGVWCLCVVSPFTTFDEVTGFVQSFKRAVFWKSPYPIVVQAAEWPYLRSGRQTPAAPVPIWDRPYVFVVVQESFNQSAITAKGPDGQWVMPYFHQLMAEGLVVSRFYANSIQTAKGQFAIVNGILPTIKGKEFTRFFEVSVQSLADVFNAFGYQSVMFDAQSDPGFDNTQNYMSRIGFQSVALNAYLKPEDAPYIWNWGPENRVVFTRFLDFLDQAISKNPRQPMFCLIETVNNHMHFQVPKQRCFVYSNPENLSERYANSVRLADQGFRVLIEGLKARQLLDKSIIVITGDHPYPLGGHGISHNESGFYEESFRIPMLILASGRVKPAVIPDNKPYSQIDIAPTVLELAGLQPSSTHFIGRSIVAPYQPRPIYLIQPYSGIIVSIVDFPWKYSWNQKTGAQYLFNLAADAGEHTNLMFQLTPQLRQIRDRLNQGLKDIYLNQYLIEQNRIWSGQTLKPGAG